MSDIQRFDADLEIVAARIQNVRGHLRLLRVELRDLIGQLHRLNEAIEQLPPERNPDE